MNTTDSVQTNQIDLTTNHFLTNKNCNVLIFDSPCFVSNEVLYKSTATCQYLKDDNLYFLIKMAWYSCVHVRNNYVKTYYSAGGRGVMQCAI